MFERILVCLDGSERAEQVLPYATEQALRFGGRVTLLQIMGGPTGIHKGVNGTSTDVMQEEIQRQEAEIKGYLEGVAKPLLEKSIALECVTLRALPVGDAIVSYATDNAIDLICITTCGHSGLKRAVFGSVADYVLRKADAPILLIKPEENDT